MLKGFTILVVSVPNLRAPGIVSKDPVVLVSEMEKTCYISFLTYGRLRSDAAKYFQCTPKSIFISKLAYMFDHS